MMDAKDIVVWINTDTKEVMVTTYEYGRPDGRKDHRGGWCDPIGAAYSEWHTMTDKERVRLMLETVIDLGMQGTNEGSPDCICQRAAVPRPR